MKQEIILKFIIFALIQTLGANNFVLCQIQEFPDCIERINVATTLAPKLAIMQNELKNGFVLATSTAKLNNLKQEAELAKGPRPEKPGRFKYIGKKITKQVFADNQKLIEQLEKRRKNRVLTDSQKKLYSVASDFERIYEQLPEIAETILRNFALVLKERGVTPRRLVLYWYGGRIKNKPLKPDSDIDLIIEVDDVKEREAGYKEVSKMSQIEIVTVRKKIKLGIDAKLQKYLSIAFLSDTTRSIAKDRVRVAELELTTADYEMIGNEQLSSIAFKTIWDVQGFSYKPFNPSALEFLPKKDTEAQELSFDNTLHYKKLVEIIRADLPTGDFWKNSRYLEVGPGAIFPSSLRSFEIAKSLHPSVEPWIIEPDFSYDEPVANVLIGDALKLSEHIKPGSFKLVLMSNIIGPVANCSLAKVRVFFERLFNIIEPEGYLVIGDLVEDLKELPNGLDDVLKMARIAGFKPIKEYPSYEINYEIYTEGCAFVFKKESSAANKKKTKKINFDSSDWSEQVKDVLAKSKLNNPEWLGSLNKIIEKKYNNGKPLEILNIHKGEVEIFGQRARARTHLFFDELLTDEQLSQLNKLKESDYIYLTIIDENKRSDANRNLQLAGISYRIVITKKLAIKRALDVKYYQVANPVKEKEDEKNTDILFLHEITISLEDEKPYISINNQAIHPTLKGKGLVSEAYPEFVEFLSRYFVGIKIEGSFFADEALHLFKEKEFFKNVKRPNSEEPKKWVAQIPKRFSKAAWSSKNLSIGEKIEKIKEFYKALEGRKDFVRLSHTKDEKGEHIGTFMMSNLDAVNNVLDILPITKDTRACDLGSGVGNVVYFFAVRGAQAVGYEIDKILHNISKLALTESGLKNILDTGKISFKNTNFLEEDLSKFDIIFYYWDSIMKKKWPQLKAQLLRELKPGAMLVVYGKLDEKQFAEFQEAKDLPGYETINSLTKIYTKKSNDSESIAKELKEQKNRLQPNIRLLEQAI